MQENYRRFDAGPDPFGRIWDVEFRWLQNGISIRHADTIDAKFVVRTEGEEAAEKIIALPHLSLLALSKKTGHAITDPWCLKLAAKHLTRMIVTAEDMDKLLVTVNPAELDLAAGILQPA